MADSFIRQITSELVNYMLPHLSVLFCGVDMTGPHIYMVYNDQVGCYDNIGFASIGIGARHANSQSMFQGHTPQSSVPETLLLAYTAKKRAEVAPGVGTETDIFAIGPQFNSYVESLNPDLRAKLDEEYAKIVAVEREEQLRARKEVQSYVAKLIDSARQRNEESKTQRSGDEPLPELE
jgi:hypothetical protein